MSRTPASLFALGTRVRLMRTNPEIQDVAVLVYSERSKLFVPGTGVDKRIRHLVQDCVLVKQSYTFSELRVRDGLGTDYTVTCSSDTHVRLADGQEVPVRSAVPGTFVHTVDGARRMVVSACTRRTIDHVDLYGMLIPSHPYIEVQNMLFRTFHDMDMLQASMSLLEEV